MLSVALMLSLLAGQTPANEVGLVPDGQGGYQAIDDSGSPWRSEDKAWLQTYIAARNVHIKATGGPPGEPGADKGPAEFMVNGVAMQRIENTGQEWYGGNVAMPVEGPHDGPSHRLHLTVIGDGADAIVGKWRKSPGFAAVERSMGDRLAVQAFPDASNPLVADVCLPHGGKPDVVIQAADGTVMDRWQVDPGADAIAGQLRRCDPDYKPEADPTATGTPWLTEDVERSILIGAAVLAGLMVLRKALK